MKSDKILHFKIAIILVLKELRRQKNNVTQSEFNADFSERYGFIHNMGRSETKANFTMETLFLYCDYFGISTVNFFQEVENVSKERILEYIDEKNKRKKNSH